MIISTEMFGPVLVIKYVVLLNETRISAVLRYGDIPHSLGDIPEVSRRTVRGPSCELSAAYSPTIMNLDGSVTYSG